MISTQLLLYQLDMMLNKIASNEHQSVPLTDKIIALNKAQIKLINSKVGSPRVLGLDAYKARYASLQNLIVPFEELSVVATGDVYNSYAADLTTTAEEYFLPLDAYVMCTKGGCSERRVDVTKQAKHGDIATLMNNYHYSPSFEYQDTFSVISDDKFIIMTDGTFSIDKLHLSYLRHPQKIDASGYINFDGSPSTDQDCELVKQLEDELLNLAVLELAMDTQNSQVVQYTDIKNKQVIE